MGQAMLSQDRQRELEPLSIRVYQQISVGYPKEQIMGQFERIGADPNEAQWLWDTGKQRYLGYQQHRLKVNRETGRSFVLGGLSVAGLASLIIFLAGWPTAGRQVGMAYTGLIGGTGAFIYGAYIWLTAQPTDTRSDLD
jgi:hypothetical protein